jgi:hypothetical protein
VSGREVRGEVTAWVAVSGAESGTELREDEEGGIASCTPSLAGTAARLAFWSFMKLANSSGVGSDSASGCSPRT